MSTPTAVSSPPALGPSASSRRSSLRRHWERYLIGGLLFYFAVRLIFFAATIEHQAPPDEITHFPRVQLFSEGFWIPQDSAATAAIGPVGYRPYLYYLLMGKLLHLNALPLSDLVFLRLVNCILGILTVLFCLRAARLLTKNRLVPVLTLVITTNVLMFTGVSASVNYDNLANLCAAAAFFFLLSYIRKPSLEDLLFLSLSLLAGTLTKPAFLPLAFIVVVLFLVHERCQLLRWKVPERIRWNARLVVLVVAVGVLVVLNGSLYLGNLMRFHRLSPTADQVLTHELAMENRIYARNYVVSQYESGRVSFDEAMRMTAQVSNPSNRRRAVQLLQRLKNRYQWQSSMPGPEMYPFIWTEMMLSDGLGYRGHRVMRKHGLHLYPYVLLILVSGMVFVRKSTLATLQGRLVVTSAVIAFFYGMVLMWMINYPIFRSYGVIDFVVQGRYLFLVIAPLSTVFSYCVLSYTPRKWQPVLALVVALVFVLGDFPFFQSHADPCWFMGDGYESQCQPQ